MTSRTLGPPNEPSRVAGRVLYFNAEKRFGFAEDAQETKFFIPPSSVKQQDPAQLRAGQNVSFFEGPKDAKGYPTALNLQLER